MDHSVINNFSDFTEVADNFVGSCYGLGLGVDKHENHICPVACRPKAHKDWSLC